jgi:hypothetical protein
VLEPSDRLLIDPDKADLLAALDSAAQHIGLQMRGAMTRRALLEQIAGSAEGRRQMEHVPAGEHRPRYVSVAWWSDHQGRKHVRVAAGDPDTPDWQPGYSRLDDDLRPPLWHAHPGRVFRVTRAGQEPAWLASCACGATGEPGSLAWMGPRCGPCHDRVEEGQPHPDEATPPLVATGWQVIYAVSFTPDGQRLALTTSYRCVNLVALDGTRLRRLFGDQDAGEEDEFRALALSRDGRFLAVGDPLEWCVRVWDLDEDTEEEELFFDDAPLEDQVHALVFAPAEPLLAACNHDGTLTAWRYQEGGWEEAYSRRVGATALAFSPPGRTLAVGRRRGRVDLVSPLTWKHRGHIETGCNRFGDVLFLHYTAKDRLVALTGSQSAERARDGHALRLLDVKARRELRNCSFPFPISAIASSPDGRYLAWLVHDEKHSLAEVTFWDVERWQKAGALEWDTEDVLHCLDFSPDGQTLVTGSSSGVVKFWPWRLLLGV